MERSHSLSAPRIVVTIPQMASAAQLKALLQSHADGDDSRFYAVGLQLAAAEARKGHTDLARDLRDIVEKTRSRESHRDARTNLLHIAQPQGEVSDLLTVRQADARLSDLILDKAAGAHIRRVLNEQRQLEKLKSHSLRPRQTLLLTGPPGCGKTLTASAIAGELGLPLFIVRLESLMTRYLGETASKLRMIFDAVERTRAVYLFDEFDSIGIARGSENDVGEMRRVLNAFLVFVENHRGNSVIIAATNHGHLLDRALYRRFDDLIELGLPNTELAERTFRERLAGQKSPRLDYAKLAAAAQGLSFAEITRVCEESIKDMLLHDKQRLTTDAIMGIISERRMFLDRRT
jgi:SpoVK/Ycf46/Vps4 family AAA+-type ATPase